MAAGRVFGHPPIGPKRRQPVKILSCDDHSLFREGLRQVLQDLPETYALVEARTAAEAREALAAEPEIGLVLLDLDLPDARGLEFLSELRAKFPLVGIAIVSASERPADVRASLDQGAVGYLPKSSDRALLLRALQVVLAGGAFVPPHLLEATRSEGLPGLTQRQKDVAGLLAKGLTNKEIAAVLGIGTGTVKTHVAAILRELGASNRTEAVVELMERGVVPPG